MFQMSKQLFEQCWPAIAAQIEVERTTLDAGDDALAAGAPSAATEAGYVLGVAIGYALRVAPTTGVPVSISVPSWRADACGKLNWPQAAATRMAL
ncbi:MAG: hypothetical protein HZB40_08030 [Rhodocyclales bacterium]|nr:hypothetical protein [Rhodocyclales bacterium]